MNKENTVANGVELKTSVTDIKQTQMAISMKKMNDTKNIRVVIPKQILVEENRTIAIEQEAKDFYYVYVKGEVLLATSDVSEAIHLAYDKNGVIVDSNLRYIFKRARNNSQTVLPKLTVSEADKNGTAIAKCISIMLAREDAAVGVSELMTAGETPAGILQEYLPNAVVLELRNCTMQELLYFIDQGTPVYAKIGSDRAVLLVGYNASYVHYYDPISEQTQSTSYEQIESMLYSGGSYAIAYVK